jgi:glycosyltransferase involved in cell wall biosynthesis
VATLSLTTVILAKNSQSTLEQAIQSVHWSPQIIVVDDQSTDSTTTIAKAAGVRVVSYALESFDLQRNFGLSLCTTDWAFFLDADEYCTDELAKEIQTVVQSNEDFSFQISRRDIFMGKELKHGETSRTWLTRLAKVNDGQWVRPVHEVWKTHSVTQRLKGSLVHDSRSSVSQFIEKINGYTSVESEYRLRKRMREWLPAFFLLPLGKFVWNYLFQAGFLDGFPGLALAWLMSLHSVLVRIKTYEKNRT